MVAKTMILISFTNQVDCSQFLNVRKKLHRMNLKSDRCTWHIYLCIFLLQAFKVSFVGTLIVRTYYVVNFYCMNANDIVKFYYMDKDDFCNSKTLLCLKNILHTT